DCPEKISGAIQQVRTLLTLADHAQKLMFGDSDAWAGDVVIVLCLQPELDASAFGQWWLEVTNVPFVAVLDLFDGVGAEIELDRFDFCFFGLAYAITNPCQCDTE